jgi:hypothetical protein
MKALLGFTAAIFAVSVHAAQPQPDFTISEPSPDAEQGNEIIVEAPRLSEVLKNTTLTLVRGRDMRATFKMREDGTFVSAMNGLQSDFGKWRVEGNTVCFDGRMLDTFCSSELFGKRPGDTWVGSGYDGKRWEAGLNAND